MSKKKKPYPDNVIPFPSGRTEAVSEEDIRKLEISHQSVQDLVIMAACVNMSTTFRGKFEEQCRENVKNETFPCSENCGCYTHMLSSMALELVFDGPRADEARGQLYREYSDLIKRSKEGKPDDAID